MYKGPDIIVPIFIGTWIVLGILSFYLFIIKNNYNFKVKYFKYFIILTGCLFAGFISLMGMPWQVHILVIPSLILISYLNIKFTKFCKNCGKTIIINMLFGKIKFCPHCGNELINK
ncbi:MAG: hypothetical protein V1739_04300 [Candidatus Omnitrophota bacterium]